MNNIEHLKQRGYFQQYKQDKNSGKRQTRSGSRKVKQARNEEESIEKEKSNFCYI